MRTGKIIAKVLKHNKWQRRQNDNWCELEQVTIKGIESYNRDKELSAQGTRKLILINEASYMWPPKWLYKHYEPIEIIK